MLYPKGCNIKKGKKWKENGLSGWVSALYRLKRLERVRHYLRPHRVYFQRLKTVAVSNQT